MKKIFVLTLLLLLLFETNCYAEGKSFKFMESSYSNPKYYIAKESDPPEYINDLRNTNVYFPANSSTMDVIKQPGRMSSPSISEITGHIFNIEGYYLIIDSNGFSSFYRPCWRLVDIDNNNVIWVQIYSSSLNRYSFRSANELNRVLQGVDALRSYINKTLWYNRKSGYSYKMHGNLQHLEEVKIKDISYDNGELVITIQRNDGMVFEWKEPSVLKNEYGVIPGEDLITKTFLTENPYEKYNWSNDVWEAIKNYKIFIGWNKEQCILSLGEPRKINRTVGTWGTYEQWVYNDKYVYFENDELVAWQD